MKSISIGLTDSEYLTLDSFVRRALPLFFVLTYVTTILRAFIESIDQGNWSIADWLINYQGGMIRRGFVGNIIYRLSEVTNVNPAQLALGLSLVSYALFFMFSYSILMRQKTLLPYVPLIFSPFVFLFQVNDVYGGYRKEVMYFALLAFLVFSSLKYSKDVFHKIFYAILLFYPVLIMTHEMLAVYLPYVVVVYVSFTKITKKRLVILFLLLLPAIGSFIAVVVNPGTTKQLAAIVASLAKLNYIVDGGAIASLDKSLITAVKEVQTGFDWKVYFGTYIPALFLAALAYFPVRHNLKVILKSRFSLVLILMSIGGSIALFVVAWDWGRFIYVHLVSLFLISFLGSSQHVPELQHSKSRSGEFRVYFAAACFIFYTVFWHIPHTGGFKRPFFRCVVINNVVAFGQPYLEVLIPDTFERFKKKIISGI